MFKVLLLLTCSLAFCSVNISAQQNGLLAGPMPGNVDLRSAAIWAEVSQDIKQAELHYYPKDLPAGKKIVYAQPLGLEFNPLKFNLNALEPGAEYQYYLVLNGKRTRQSPFSFRTKTLWQYRMPAPDFSFLTGSCAYFNEPPYDRPGRPYGHDSTIFLTMSGQQAAFTLWLGDSWYTREVDYYSPWGLNYRLALDRRRPVLQPLLAAMPHYFIWDDHDYGPNNAGKWYTLKDESRKLFQQYTLNPSYGMKEEGIFTRISYSDVDFFLTDNRYFRSHDRYPDSINGQPNPDKTYFGKSQLEWLKNELLASRATFKIIASGSQVLNPASTFDCFRTYSHEFSELMRFLETAGIEGVLFLTGDRHHSEVISMPREGNYTLYDITVSPFTAGIGYVRGGEENNPARVKGTLIEQHNFGKVSITGEKGKRKLRVDFIGVKGEALGSWEIPETALKRKGT